MAHLWMCFDMRRVLLCVLLLVAVPVSAGPVEDGLSAYDKGDYGAAVMLFREAAAQGDAWAQYTLGAMYGSGQGVPQDYAEAVKWYRLAAAQGQDAAQSNLGGMYWLGRGVPEDSVRAHMWFNLAASQGNNLALTLRDYGTAAMSPAQIAEAQKLASECQARNFKNCD